MGSVWLAQDLSLKAEVAIKLIDPEQAESPESLARFQREAQAAAAIRSTHVVQTLDYGIDGSRAYIAMELLKGESLGARLDRLDRLSPRDTAHILGQVARALAIAHKQGIVHRDLKPDNIFIAREEEDEVTKVLDFGIARKTTMDQSDGVKTRTGALLGTPFYMSPEQATGQDVDHLTDVWAFGVIAFECLTGERAFTGESLGRLFHLVCIAEPPIPSQRGSVPLGFDEWFACATARDKARRYQSIRQAADALSAICIDRGASADLDGVPRSVTAPGADLVARKLSGALGKTPAPSAITIPGLSKRRYGLLAFASVAGVVVVAGIAGSGWMRLDRNVAVGATPTANLAVVAASTNGDTSASADADPKTPESTSEPAASGVAPESSGAKHTQAVAGTRATPAHRAAPPTGVRQQASTRRQRPIIDDDNVAAF